MDISKTKQDTTDKTEQDQTRYLAELTREECELLASIAHTEHVHDGEVIFEEGERDDQLYIILNGHIEMGHREEEHNKWVDFGVYGVCDLDEVDETTNNHWCDVHTLDAGECVGEMSFIQNGAHNLTARAKGEGDLLVVDAPHLKEIVKNRPEMVEHIYKALKKTYNKCR
ncbi:MAG: cyclic nucleotide-binding domain-containing protein [Magnetococcales bacterium]|nr:cyclic nucleotide-binding domain-containing protein [Magnetococcales bacterium]